MTDDSQGKYLKYKQKYLEIKQKYLEPKQNLQYGAASSIPDKSLAIDEAYFWGRQMGDHALFFNLLLEEPKLKERALELNKKWLNFMKVEFSDKGINIENFDLETRKNVKVFLTPEEITKIEASFNFDELLILLEELKNFKQKLLDILNKGEWIGWAYKSFVEHTLMELSSFHNRIQGKQTPLLDIKFYNKMSKEHTGFADNLTDYTPENIEIKNTLRNVFNTMPLLNGSEKEQYIILSQKYLEGIEKTSTDIQKMIHDKNYSSIIHPELINHVVREQQRATMKLKELKQ